MNMEVQKTDAELVQAVLEGDSAAFGDILDRHLSAAYKFAYRYLRSEDDAEDVSQEAFVRAWKNLKKFDQSKNFKTWLFAIVKNAALDLIKKKKPVLFSRIGEEEGVLDAFLAPYVEGDELPDALFDRKMTNADLARAISTLPPGYRAVLTMRYNENLKFREIAEALHMPIDTVKSQHRRGLALLRKIVTGEATGSSLA
jgi:RNA polymerase sigma-70 factor, ECF subfamily